MEVQIRRRKFKEICINNHIDYALSQLNSFIDIDFCCRTVKDIYCKFITRNINEFAHFYAYIEAKKRIDPNDKELLEKVKSIKTNEQ